MDNNNYGPVNTNNNRLEGPGILLYTLKPGDGRTYPKRGDTCRVHFEAFLADDGQMIDSTRKRHLPFEFKVGCDQVVEGWDHAILHMSLGEVAEVTIPHLYAYGAMGFPPTIPPNVTLLYKIELLHITSGTIQQKGR